MPNAMIPLELSSAPLLPLTAGPLPSAISVSPGGHVLLDTSPASPDFVSHLAETAPLIPYHDGFGDVRFNLFRPTQSPEQLVDAGTRAINALPGVEMQRPLGQSREILSDASFGAGILLGAFVIYHEYSRRPLLPGRVPFSKAFPGLAYFIGLSAAARFLGTDAYAAFLRKGSFDLSDMNTNVFFSMMVYWAIFSPVWPWITKTAFPLSGPFMKFFNPRHTFHKAFIVSKGKFQEGTRRTIANLLAQNRDSLSFKVTAEHVARMATLSSLACLSQQTEAEVRISADYEKIMQLREELLDLQKEKGISLAVSHETSKNIKRGFLEPGAGKLLKGSLIRVGDKRVKLSHDMEVNAGSGRVYVFSGVLENAGSLEIGNGRLLKSHKNSNFTVTIKGRAARVLKFVAETVPVRTISGFKYHPLNATPDFVKKALRSKFAPTPVDITLRNVLSDVHNEKRRVAIVDAVTAMASETMYASRLKKNPMVPVSRAVIEYLRDREKIKTTTLEMPMLAFRLLRWRHGQLRIEETLGNSRVLVKIPVALVEKELLDPTRQFYPAVKAGQIKIRLENPLRSTSVVWKITDAEDVAMRTRAGSSESLAEIEAKSGYQTTDQTGILGGVKRQVDGTQHGVNRFVRGAGVLGKGVVRSMGFGRAWSILALTAAGFMMSAAVTSTSKFAQGFNDPWVYLKSGGRVGLSRILNAMFAPGIVNIVGLPYYSNFSYYIPSVTYLTFWEMFNEIREIDELLYKQKVLKLLGENRQEQRIDLAREIIELEKTANPGVRKGILGIRLSNLLQTGIYHGGDGTILKEMYADGLGKNPRFASHFLFALALDTTLWEQITLNEPDIMEYFEGQMDDYADAIQQEAENFR